MRTLAILAFLALGSAVFGQGVTITGRCSISGNLLISVGAAQPSQVLAWNAQLSSTNEVASASTSQLIVTNGAAQNSTVVVIVAYNASTAEVVSSITDARGNSYTWDWGQTNGNRKSFGAHSKLGTALQANDIITVNWTSPSLTYRAAWAGNVLNSTASDVSATNSTLSASVTATATTTAATTLAVGAVYATSGSAYTPSNLSQVSTFTLGDGSKVFYLQGTFSGASSHDVGGALSPADNYIAGWTAFK